MAPSEARATREDGINVAGLVALFVAASTLRVHIIGIGPLLPDIQRDLAVSFGVVGALVTIPVVCMGVFAVAAIPIGKWLGTRKAIAACLLTIALFGFARSLASSAVVLLLLTVPLGIGVGVSGPLLPVAVKERHPAQAGLATGVYATGMQIGSAFAVAGSVPLATLLGGWRGPLAVFSLAGLGALVIWMVATRSTDSAALPTLDTSRPPAWRRPDSWLLAWLFFLIGLPFFGLMAWLTAAYTELGWTLQRAGLLTATVVLTGTVGSLAPGFLARTPQARRDHLMGAAVLLLGSIVGLALAPWGAWVWAGIAGICMGALFTILLTLPIDVAGGPREVGAVASVMLTVGYLLAALSPSLLGAIRDLFGTFRASLWVIGIFVVLLVVTSALTRFRLRNP